MKISIDILLEPTEDMRILQNPHYSPRQNSNDPTVTILSAVLDELDIVVA